MKISVTLTFDSHVLRDIKEKFTGKNLSTFTNNLYTNWLETREREELIAAYKSIAKNKVYKEIGVLTENIAIESWNKIDKYEDECRKKQIP